MACGIALKRPHDYDDYLGADGRGDVKRARHTQAHCSPFRAQIGTIAASLPTTGVSSAIFSLSEAKDHDAENASPFATVGTRTQLSPGQLESYLRAEVRYLKRRHLIPRRPPIDNTQNTAVGAIKQTSDPTANDSATQQEGITHNYREAPSSPKSNSSDSDSESFVAPKVSNTKNVVSTKELYEKPQFSLKQVQMICERLLKQQEVRLRFEYETVLSQRLAEQHDQYVQFAREQIERQHRDNDANLSYLS